MAQQEGDWETAKIRDLLKHLYHANLLLVLLLDEFEYRIPTEIPEQETRTRAFLSGLRALINQRERVMSLIVATREPLADLCRKVRFMGSPFYNNFATVILRPFSLREADGFLDQMLVGTGVTFTPEDKTSIDAERAKGFRCFRYLQGTAPGRRLHGWPRRTSARRTGTPSGKANHTTRKN